MDGKIEFKIGICNMIFQVDTADQNARNSVTKAAHYLKNINTFLHLDNKLGNAQSSFNHFWYILICF